MTCPECGEDLTYSDYYGQRKHSEHYWIYPRSWIEKEGEIFKCENEECNHYDEFFYTDKFDELHRGYPC